ncbi:ATP-grasp domain-containing protein [Kitasatospora mediocidica]|uniref:ATP-grasp domain-containing protein n=1 Tax=Kitasatospora mediocidica TaxID=58352 RepID=UPI00055D0B4F|nr:ATP-grasp domain-containing protein [Kitasatospora mediocidica]
MSRPGRHGMTHVIVMNRWKDHYADYARYIDHTRCTVSYVTSPAGRASVPEGAAEIVTLENIEDLAQLRAAVLGLAERHGRPDRLITLKEEDLENAALLRTELGLPGQRPQEVPVFRDKVVMVGRIAAAGLPAPAFAAVSSAAEVVAFAAEHGWDLMVKPRSGSGSAGVVRVSGPQELAEVDFDRWPMMVQVRNPHPVCHVDGVFDGEKLVVWRGSRYLNSCFDFAQGTFLGSVEQGDPELHRIIGDSTEQFMRALTDQPTPFHLELFLEQSESGTTCSFLEVGGRVGGSETPFLWREVHGYDLMEAAFHIQLGVAPTGGVDWDTEDIAGWLLLPAPAERPCRITAVRSMTDRTPGPYAEALLAPGDILPVAHGYEHVGGRFRFRASSAAELTEAIMATYLDFTVSAVPVGTGDGA